MFNTQNKRQLLALTFNFVIMILECVGFYLSISKYNNLYFVYYTEDCNILTLCSSLVFIFFNIKNIIKKGGNIPLWVHRLRYITTCSLSLTFIIVFLTIFPVIDKNFIEVMLSDSFLYHHFLCPIFSITSFVFFEDYISNKKNDILIACSFTFIYGFIITILNFFKILKGPYSFFHIYEQPLYFWLPCFISIIICTYTVAKVLLKSNKVISIKYGSKY